MADLKLAKLPDRTPVKLTITLMPDQKAALEEYAALYEQNYGRKESIADLVPAIVTSFLAADRGFQKFRKG